MTQLNKMNVGKLTNKQAQTMTARSSFYSAMRILPKAQREAMYQVYAFCRAVDDIADSDLPRKQRQLELKKWQEKIDQCYEGDPPCELMILAQEIRKFSLNRQDFYDMILGMEMDAAEDICAPDEATLDLYCDRVASAAGRLSVKIFGIPDEKGEKLSYHLGRALQLTNILRDIDEDAKIGRCYLPKELLVKAGILSKSPQDIVRAPAVVQVCEELVQRALIHFQKADQIMLSLPKQQVRAPRLMYIAYYYLLQAAIKRGFALPRQRLHKPRVRLLWAFARYAFF